MKNRLRQLRKENNLTVRELGEKVKIDYSTISRLETGKTIWNEDYLTAFSNYFDVSIDYLLGKTELRKYEDPKYNLNDFQFALYSKTRNLSDKQKKDILKIIDALTEEDD